MEKSNIIIGIVLLGIAGAIGYLVGSNLKMLPRMLSQPISSLPHHIDQKQAAFEWSI